MDTQTFDPETHHDEAMAAQTFDPQTDSPLCSLPAELRNRIWDFALTVPTASGPVQLVKSPADDDQTPPTCLSLVQTCRKIHGETHTTFHEINPLGIDVQHIHDFVRSTPADRLKGISKLKVQIPDRGEFVTHAIKSLVPLVSLKIIDFTVVMNSPRFGIELFKEMERGFMIKAFRRAAVLERVRIVGVNRVGGRMHLYEWDIQNGERLVAEPVA